MNIKDRISRKLKTVLNGKIKPCTSKEYSYQKVFDAAKFVFPGYKSLTGSIDFAKYEDDIREFGVYKLKNGIFVVGSEEVYSSKKNVLEPITAQHQNPKIGTVKNLKVQQIIKGTVATLFLSGLEKNYYHFTAECLLRWWVLKNSGIEPDFYAVYTGTKETSFQRQLLELVGIPKEKLLQFPEGTVIQAETLVAPTLVNNWKEGSWRGYQACIKQWLPLWAKDLYSFIISRNAEKESYAKSPYVYIERDKAPVRKIINSAELFECLKKYGFIKVYLEDLTVSEQITLFNHAKIIVSPHGAGLANLSYCQPKTQVLELFPEYFHEPGLRILSTVKDLDYNYLICKSPVIENVQPVAEDILVEDISVVENWIKENI